MTPPERPLARVENPKDFSWCAHLARGEQEYGGHWEGTTYHRLACFNHYLASEYGLFAMRTKLGRTCQVPPHMCFADPPLWASFPGSSLELARKLARPALDRDTRIRNRCWRYAPIARAFHMLRIVWMTRQLASACSAATMTSFHRDFKEPGVRPPGMDTGALRDIGIFFAGSAALVGASGYWRSVTKRWSYREWRREIEMAVARFDMGNRLIRRAARRQHRDEMVAALREALDRLDVLELSYREKEGPEPPPPGLGDKISN